MVSADRSHLGANATGKPAIPEALCCQVHGLVSHGDVQMARLALSVLA